MMEGLIARRNAPLVVYASFRDDPERAGRRHGRRLRLFQIRNAIAERSPP
jgi:hypothetical protein